MLTGSAMRSVHAEGASVCEGMWDLWSAVTDTQPTPIWRSSVCVSARRSTLTSSRTGRDLCSRELTPGLEVLSWMLSVR